MITDAGYNELSAILTDNNTTAELKAILSKVGTLDKVESSSTNSYAKLKEDYVSIAMELLIEYNQGFKLKDDYLANCYLFNYKTLIKLMDWLV